VGRDRSIFFAGPAGHGEIGGQLAPGDLIDLADITAGANATLTYSGDNSPGILTVSDGIQSVSITLLGNYMASSFVAQSDGHGGTIVHDPPMLGPVNDYGSSGVAGMTSDFPGSS